VVIGVEFENFAQMAFTEHDDMINAVSAKSRRRGVRYIRFAKAPGGNGPTADTHRGEPMPDDVPIDGVAVAEQVFAGSLAREGLRPSAAQPIRRRDGM
jgi:hypothetical protein